MFLTTAIAEAADTVSTSSSFHFELDFSTIIAIVFAGYFILSGLASIFTGKVYGFGKTAQNYTDESLGKYARPWGLGMVIMGIGFAVLDLHLTCGYGTSAMIWIGIAVLVVALAIIALGAKKCLVKKENK